MKRKPMTAGEEQAERMVVWYPSHDDSSNGSVLIGDGAADAQVWELITLRPNKGLGKKCAAELRGFIAAAIDRAIAKARREGVRDTLAELFSPPNPKQKGKKWAKAGAE